MYPCMHRKIVKGHLSFACCAQCANAGKQQPDVMLYQLNVITRKSTRNGTTTEDSKTSRIHGKHARTADTHVQE